jgi:hypothetical protein
MTTTLMSAPVQFDSIITPAPQRDFTISAYMQEVINGSMLGDASITEKKEQGNVYSAAFSLTTACEQYSDFLLKQLPGMRQILINAAAYPGNIYYQVNKCNKQFLAMREEWYPSQANGKAYKEVPFGLELTPTTVLHWYLGDGHKDKGGYYIKLHTEGFKAKDVEMLALKLSNAVGIPVKAHQLNLTSENPYVSYKVVYISGKANVAKFLDYIGDCPFAQYRHKWVDGLTAREAKFTPNALVTAGTMEPKVMRKLVSTTIDKTTNRKAFKLYNVKSI